MPPKKDSTAATGEETLIAGFTNKEVKLIAAAFLSSVGSDKYNYDLMATLTSNTNGSLKKMWPPVKKKAIEAHPSFATFLGAAGAAGAANAVAAKPIVATKANNARKRKAADAETDGEVEDEDDLDEPEKKAAAKGKGRPKKVKEEETVEEDADAEATTSAGSKAKKKAPAAKGRGRPKKAAAVKDEVVEDAESEQDDEASKEADQEEV